MTDDVISVIASTQYIITDPTTGVVSIILAGPQGPPGSGGGGGGGGGGPDTIIWQKQGLLSAPFISTQRFTSIGTTQLDSVIAAVTDDEPSGDTIIIDLLLNGTDSIFETSPTDTRPIIQDETTVSNLAIPTLISAMSNLEFIVPAIIQVGSTTPGTGIIIQLEKH